MSAPHEPGRGGRSSFPSVLEMPRRLPVPVWIWPRMTGLAAFLAVVAALAVRPSGGLFVFWHIVVPVLPLLFFVAPGLWRNICPLATANQLPRRLGLTWAASAPEWLRRSGYSLAMAVFFVVVCARKSVLEIHGPVLAALLVSVQAAAFAGGMLLKGKSGWCSSICPMLPVQRLYGQTPFVRVGNAHCEPCLGCTKNCYDFNPTVAYQADMYDPDPQWSAPRRFFAGAFPGLVVAFFTVAPGAQPSVGQAAFRFGAVMLTSAGLFFAAQAVLRLSPSVLAAVFGGTALNTYYWYAGKTLAGAAGQITGADLTWLVWPVRAGVSVLTALWLVRTWQAERRFLDEVVQSQRVHLTPVRTQRLADEVIGDRPPEVRFLPGDQRSEMPAGSTLLEAAEAAAAPVEAGCRMGLCGADPVTVVQGAEHLSAMDDTEANTLRRLGLGGATRLACCARIAGDVCVSLTPERPAAVPPPAHRPADPAIRRVVVVGNGIAGVTAADFVRRLHPDCHIDLVGRESHRLYNRMAISRLIHGRSAMQGLYLIPEDWYDRHGITCWLNTRAHRLDVAARAVTLGTGDTLLYDRLILATGASSTVPDVPGFGLPGCFVLRDAEDAIALRGYAQERGAVRAAVLGGGLLGLEAAHGLRQLGLAVAVIERNERLLHRQVDERCSAYLTGHFSDLGIAVLCGAGPARLTGDTQVEGLVLDDHTTLACEIVVACAGIRPNADLARRSGLTVKRGVLVDDTMRTSHPDIYAAGDIAEFAGQVLGLWPVAVEQAEVAATNAMGEGRRHAVSIPAAILKGVGVDLASAGRLDPRPGDEIVVVDDPNAPSYLKLVVSAGHLAGGLVYGRPRDIATVIAAVRRSQDVGDALPALRDGRIDVLADHDAPEPSTAPPLVAASAG